MKSRRHLWVGALATIAVALTGCTAAAGSTNSSEGGSETLTYLEAQAWNSLYPPAGGFYPNGAVLNQITDRLLYQDPETLELHPWVAAELPEVNDDATEFTFTLRDGITYSDGSPLDAENVLKNIELYAQGDPERGLESSEAIANYESGEVIDEHTVKFTFSAPSPGFSQGVSTINSGLVSSSTLDRTSDEFGPGNASEIIGSGPFIVTDETIGTELSLEARDDYDWAPEAVGHEGAPAISGIELLVVEEASVRVGSVTSGQADIARQIPVPDEEQFAGDDFELLTAPTNGVNNSLSFRFAHPLLEDIRVRQALIAGIDRQAIVDTLLSDSYPVATGVLAQNALGYVDTSDYYAYDPDRAAQLLDEAGWKLNADGIRERDGETLTLTFNEALPLQRSREVVTLIQEQLSHLGVQVDLFAGDQAAQNIAREDIDTIQVYHQLVGRADYEVLKSQYFTTNRNTLLNLDHDTGEVHDEELDRLLSEVASHAADEERAQASEAAQLYLAEHAYVLPLFEEPLVYGLGAHVNGFTTESVGRPSFYGVNLDS